MTESDETPLDSRLRWYQRTWLWVAVAFVAVPLTLAWVILGALFDVNNVVFGVVGLVISVLIPMGLWMGALVTRRGWARGILSIATILLLFLGAGAVWNFVEGQEAEALNGCRTVSREDLEASPSAPEWVAALPPEFDRVFMDPRECFRFEEAFEGMTSSAIAAYAPALEGSQPPMSIETFRRVTLIMFAVFWVAPLFVLYFLRKRFQPDDVMTGGLHIAEAAGWMLLTLGGLVLILVLFVAVSNESDSGVDLARAALFVGVPAVSGVLLVRWGRRRRAPTPERSPSE